MWIVTLTLVVGIATLAPLALAVTLVARSCSRAQPRGVTVDRTTVE